MDPRFKGLTWLASSAERNSVFDRIVDRAVKEEANASDTATTSDDLACSSVLVPDIADAA